MASKFDDDEYVANLLKQDAKSAAKTYALVGIDAFNPKRQKSGAPKPNTNFLRHIIRQTDSHNAALLAREAEDANARLRSMNEEKRRERHKKDEIQRRKEDGRLTPVPSGGDSHQRSSKRRREHDRDDAKHDTRSRTREVTSRKHRDGSDDIQRHKRRHEDREDDGAARKRRHRYSSVEDNDRSHKRRGTHRGHRGHRSHSASRSRSRSRSPSRPRSYRSGNYDKSHRHRDRSRTARHAPTDPESRLRSSDNINSSRKSKLRSTSPASESDPLESLVGPLPPSIQPAVRARGRGAHKADTMGMDSRFATEYNPTADVRFESDAEDDWGDALEALRDRQRWKQQGADRLKAAGFTDEQVKKWEKGNSQNEDDVVWTKKGQAREWDRGKVVDEDGDVELKADFGRLGKISN